jgi:hypothetical protein
MGAKMSDLIAFDPATQTYLEPATGNRACIKVAHWQDPHIEVEFRWSGDRFFFDATLTGSPEGARVFRVLGSRYFEPTKARWVSFSGRDEVLTALRPFVAAWSSRAWKGRVTDLEDGRGHSAPTLEEALRPPSQAALDELVRQSKERRP